jgi:hypothetical protein
MTKISIEVRSGAARFAVAVQAPTIQQALNIAAPRYLGNALSDEVPDLSRRFFRRGWCLLSETNSEALA